MSNQPSLIASADGDFASALNASPSGWVAAMGIRFLRATSDEVTAELKIGAAHRQAYGIVHGGVHSGMIETITSVGAALTVIEKGQSVVGLENHTSFLLAVREGRLRATARPLMRGRRTQVWEATVSDGDGRTVATGRVRFIVLETNTTLAGEPVKLKRAQD
jgi:1,4-dihydroxy-2-naphthoyl-CoA hydrolase